MSRIYHLDLSASALPAERLSQALSEALERASSVTIDGNTTTPHWVEFRLASGLGIHLFEPDPMPEPDEVEVSFGFQRAISVWMSPGRGHTGEQHGDVVTTTMAVLARVRGDAALHYEYCDVWLVRRDGRLVLSDDDDVWTPELLALVDMPYVRAPLAFVEG